MTFLPLNSQLPCLDEEAFGMGNKRPFALDLLVEDLTTPGLDIQNSWDACHPVGEQLCVSP